VKVDRPLAAGSAAGSSDTNPEKGSAIVGQGLPPRFDAALQRLLTNKASLADVRRELANALYKSLEPAGRISQALDKACQSGDLANDLYSVLLRDLTQITTEEAPTDVPAPEAGLGGALVNQTPDRSPARPPVSDRTVVRRNSEASPISDRTVVRTVGPPVQRTKDSSPRQALSVSAAALRQTPPKPPSIPEDATQIRRMPVKQKDGLGAVSSDIRLGSILRDRFQLEERVAGGRMGEVFRALDLLKKEAGDADPAVAIKVLSPDLRDRPEALHLLKQEALKAQKLAHPSIVNVFDLDRAGDHFFITMEWLRGESLASRLDRSQPDAMAWPEVEEILAGVTSGLSYAHRQGMVHGDIKPGNIYICNNGQVKLLDFGLARVTENGRHKELENPYAMTRTYASCEMLEGQQPTATDDIYALACVVYRMVAGFRPHGNRTALEAERDRATPKRPSGLNSRQWQTLKSGLAYRRKNRPPDVERLFDGMRVKQTDTANHSRLGWLWATAAGVVVAVSAFFISEPGFDLQAIKRDGWQFREVFGKLSVTTATGEKTATDESSETSSPQTSTPSVSLERDQQAEAAVNETVPDLDATAVTEPSVTEHIGGSVPAVSTELTEPNNRSPISLTEAVEIETTSPAVNLDTPQDQAPVDHASPAATGIVTGFHKRRYEVREGDSYVSVPLRFPSDLQETVEVRLVVLPGSADSNRDYVPPVNDIIVVRPGDTEKVVIIPLISDSIPENAEEFVLRLFTESQRLGFDNDRALIIIVDDD
jgi:serine/threonine protein kinase